jgi:hypothetical protein
MSPFVDERRLALQLDIGPQPTVREQRANRCAALMTLAVGS